MAKAEVCNLPNNADKYIVARLVANELWYWGSWDKKDVATRAAEEFSNGIVLERSDCE